MPNRRMGLAITAVIAALLIIAPEALADTKVGFLDDILYRFQDAASGWEIVILGAASWLFWTLVVISMVWTFGMMIFRKADLGEFFAEFFRFIVFTGFFWWLLINGPHFAISIIDSLSLLGASAGGLPTAQGQIGFSPTGTSDIGFKIYGQIADNLATMPWNKLHISLVGALMGLGIMIILCLVGVNMLLLLISAWFLAYAGIFFLGFGGSRWTSDMAINYYKTVLGLAVQIMAMVLLISIGNTFIEEYYATMTIDIGNSKLLSIGALLMACIVLFVLTTRIPTLLAGIVTGASAGGSGIGSILSTGTVAAATGMAGGLAIGSAMKAGKGAYAGGAQAIMSAVSKASETATNAGNATSAMTPSGGGGSGSVSPAGKGGGGHTLFSQAAGFSGGSAQSSGGNPSPSGNAASRGSTHSRGDHSSMGNSSGGSSTTTAPQGQVGSSVSPPQNVASPSVGHGSSHAPTPSHGDMASSDNRSAEPTAADGKNAANVNASGHSSGSSSSGDHSSKGNSSTDPSVTDDTLATEINRQKEQSANQSQNEAFVDASGGGSDSSRSGDHSSKGNSSADPTAAGGTLETEIKQQKNKSANDPQNGANSPFVNASSSGSASNNSDSASKGNSSAASQASRSTIGASATLAKAVATTSAADHQQNTSPSAASNSTHSSDNSSPKDNHAVGSSATVGKNGTTNHPQNVTNPAWDANNRVSADLASEVSAFVNRDNNDPV